MAEIYNNSNNIQIVNTEGNSWAGQVNIYGDGYPTKADRKNKNKEAYDYTRDRRRMPQVYYINGERIDISESLRSRLMKQVKDLPLEESKKVLKKNLEIILKEKLKKPMGSIDRIDYARPFAEFDNRIMGYRSSIITLRGIIDEGNNTMRSIKNVFAPSSENDVNAYVKFMVKEFRKYLNDPNFSESSLITKKHIVPLIKFGLLYENEKGGFTDYYTKPSTNFYGNNVYTQDEELEIAEWCSRTKYPQSTRVDTCINGFNQSRSAKNQKIEEDFRTASDGTGHAGETVMTDEQVKAMFKNRIQDETTGKIRY